MSSVQEELMLSSELDKSYPGMLYVTIRKVLIQDWEKSFQFFNGRAELRYWVTSSQMGLCQPLRIKVSLMLSIFVPMLFVTCEL